MRVIFALIVTAWGQLVTERDLYEVLSVSRDAVESVIKSSYKKLARKYHPDANEEDTTEIFQEIAYAKEVLTDKNKRNIYDQYGHDGLKQMAEEHGGNPFANMYGDMFGFGQADVMRGDDVLLPLLVTLEELYLGTHLNAIKTNKVVRDAPGDRDCNCRMEAKTVQVGNQYHVYQNQVCDKCPNYVLMDDEVELDIEVRPGSRDGDYIRFPGQGEVEIDGDNGDLVIALYNHAHPVFTRLGDDLLTNITISLTDAILGFQTKLNHLNGETVNISRAGRTWFGYKETIENFGMPVKDDPDSYGSLIITFDIAEPNISLTEDDKLKLLSIFKRNLDPII